MLAYSICFSLSDLLLYVRTLLSVAINLVYSVNSKKCLSGFQTDSWALSFLLLVLFFNKSILSYLFHYCLANPVELSTKLLFVEGFSEHCVIFCASMKDGECRGEEWREQRLWNPAKDLIWVWTPVRSPIDCDLGQFGSSVQTSVFSVLFG